MQWDRIVAGDCLTELDKMPKQCIDLVFADPPFNIGYIYDRYDDGKEKDEYLAWTEKWLLGVKRVLKPDGSLFVAIGDEYVAEIKVRLDALGFTLRNWIVWHYTFGVNCTKKFNRSHAHILYYVMNENRFQFYPDEIRVPSARQTTYSDRRANPKGKLPDDTWVLRPQEDDRFFQPDMDAWYVARVCGTFKERVKAQSSNETAHPCQMPEAVLERIIRVASKPEDVILDPFAGSGTTLAVAKRLGRRYLGIELSESYAMYIKERLADIEPQIQKAKRVHLEKGK
jgi:DNA modification methylase